MASNQRARRGSPTQAKVAAVEQCAFKVANETEVQKPVHQVKCVMRLHEKDLEVISKMICNMFSANLMFIAGLFLMFTLNRFFN